MANAFGPVPARAMTLRLAPLLAVIAAVAVSAAAYAGRQGTTSTTTSSVAPAPHGLSLVAGDAVPVPSGTRVLTLTGAIDNPNAGRRLLLDLPTLDRMGLTSVTVYDPFRKHAARFRAIPLRNLVDVASLRSDASALHA